MKPRKKIAVLGSTGSIGRNTLEVVANFPDRFRVTSLTAHRNIGLLQEQIEQFHPRAVVVLRERDATMLRKSINGATEILFGEEGLNEVVQRDDVDMVVSALVGFAGLKPTMRAIEAGKDIALANKETLVVGGEIIMSAVKRHGVRLLPVDSEHSAILQCLRGEEVENVERLILTASGGPFRQLPKEEFGNVTVEQALNHPTWKMGTKITIDSATLMNKGLEVIEAHWLFGLPMEKIHVVVHPQSIIHSMVEFQDGSTKAQLSFPDMKLPILYALMFPERPLAPFKRMNFTEMRQMTFDEADREKFQCLALAYKAGEIGGSAPTVLNAANEVAVRKFLNRECSFAAIPSLIEEALANHTPIGKATLDDIVREDAETRRRAEQSATT